MSALTFHCYALLFASSLLYMPATSLYLSPLSYHPTRTQSDPVPVSKQLNMAGESPTTTLVAHHSVCVQTRSGALILPIDPYSTFSDTIHSPTLQEINLIICPFSANLQKIVVVVVSKKTETKQKLNCYDKPLQNVTEKTMRALESK